MYNYKTGYPQKIVRKISKDVKGNMSEIIYYSNSYGDYSNNAGTDLNEEEIDFRIAFSKAIKPDSITSSMLFVDPYTHTITDSSSPYAIYMGCTACHPKEYEKVYNGLNAASKQTGIYVHDLSDIDVPITRLIKEQMDREIDDDVCASLGLKRY